MKRYRYSELSERAKERVREWLVDDDPFDWSDYLIDDFVQVAALFGFTVGTRWHGKTSHPCVSWESYPWQAGFAGMWHSACALGVEKLLAEDRNDELLTRLAVELATTMTKFSIGGLDWALRQGITAEIRDLGCHVSNEVSLEWDNDNDVQYTHEQEGLAEDLRQEVYDTARGLCRWLAKMLEGENDYRHTDDYARETCEANDYWFDEDGEYMP